jgi:hypothetical protein
LKNKKLTRKSGDGGDDSSSSSSSSSSNPSYLSNTSTESGEDTSVNSSDSIMAFEEKGLQLDIPHITNSKQRMLTSKRIAKQLKALSTSSKLHDLKEFNATRGAIEQRKAYFQSWITILQEVLASHHRYQALLRDFPHLDSSELTITASAALGHFLRLKLRTATLHTIESNIGKENNYNRGHRTLSKPSV